MKKPRVTKEHIYNNGTTSNQVEDELAMTTT